MSRQTASIVISRPPETVYAFMDDVTREAEWQPNLRSAEQDPPGPSRVGTRKRYRSEFLGKTLDNTYVVTAVEPGRRLVSETTKGSAVAVTSEVIWEPVSGGTRVTMVVDARPKGFLRFVPDAVLEAASRKELDTALERLKAVLEG